MFFFCSGSLFSIKKRSLFFSLFLVFFYIFLYCADSSLPCFNVCSCVVIIKKYSYKPFFTAATVSASKALISDNMAATLAVLASCMTAETILSPLEST